jgi:hypothetical protein
MGSPVPGILLLLFNYSRGPVLNAVEGKQKEAPPGREEQAGTRIFGETVSAGMKLAGFETLREVIARVKIP